MEPSTAVFDVLAIGELNVDLIFTGLSGAPVLNHEILARGFTKTMGSSTALCAANIARLGLSVAFCGKVGGDEHGAYMLEELQKRNIDTRFCKVDPTVETGITLALNWNGDRALVTFPGSITDFSVKDFDPAIIQWAKHIHVGSFFLQSGLREALPAIFKEASQRGITTSLDAGWDDSGNWDYGLYSVLKYTDIFFPNESEALEITKAPSFDKAAAKLAEFCRIAVVKRGPRGAYCVSGGETRPPEAAADSKNGSYTVAGMDVEVIDTTGAGDAFNAGFIYAYRQGRPISDCLEYGNACGSLCVMATGGAGADLTPRRIEGMIKARGGNNAPALDGAGSN
jgi:sugar/nucleoside kinase (ribokinase family)